jgi:hypothetical protein
MISAQLVTDLLYYAGGHRWSDAGRIGPREATDLLRAIDIADASSICEIESSCEREKIEGIYWYDVTPELDPAKRGPEEVAAMQQALDHLTARGLLVRDAVNPNLVSFKTEAA